MTPGDEATLTRFNDRLADTVEILQTTSEDPRSEIFRQFGETLARLVPRVKISSEKGENNDLPMFQVSTAIHYQAVPSGPELSPFLNCLEWLDKGAPPLAEADLRQLDGLVAPAFAQIFIAPNCPHCPVTVSRLLPLAASAKRFHLKVIDGDLFPELAKAADIRSAPTVILDDRFRWTGRVDIGELVEMAVKRDPTRLGAAALRGLIEEGNAARLADMMQQAGAVFPAFIELLQDDKWPVRLGAMVAFEYLVDAAPSLAAQVVQPLWERFPELEDTIKGDVLHVLAQTGCKALIPQLTVISDSGASEELRAAAAEALAHLSGYE